MLRELERLLMEEKVPEMPTLAGVISGEQEAPELSDIGRYISGSVKNGIKGKARDMLYQAEPEDQDYRHIRETVERVFRGEDLGFYGEEVPLSDPELNGNWGFHYGKRYKVPQLSEIPGMFGEEGYKSAAEGFVGHQSLDQATQNYIKAHEIAEALHQYRNGITEELPDSEHGRFEAYLQTALESVGHENPEALDAYNAGLALNSTRGEGDSFLQSIKRASSGVYENIMQKGREIFGPVYQPVASASY